MSTSNKAEANKKKSLLNRFLDVVERGGNALPHPATLFLLFSAAVVFISEICFRAGVSAQYTTISKGEAQTVVKNAVSLMNADGIRYMFSSAVSNFTGFAPLGTVLVAMLGVGVAEGTGFIGALIRKVVMGTPKQLITIVVVFLGVMSNVASDAGYVVLVPLGAIIFMNFGRHPLAGIAAAFAGVSGGFSANLLVGTIDPLLGGISTEAARIIDPSYNVLATANYYFMAASTFLIAFIGWFVVEKIVEPRLGEYSGSHKVSLDEQTPDEIRGLRFATVSIVIFVGIILALILPEGGVLRDQATGEILGRSPFVKSIVTIIMMFFLFPGVAYGLGAGTIRSDKDVVHAMSKAMSTMGGYLVLAFFAAQFIKYFSYTNLGVILAAKGAEFLQAINFTGLPLIVAFILVSAFINLFIGSASAKWAIMAPVFIPMLMQMGFTPEFTQVAYRIGDSTTNIISPLMSYFAVIVAFAQAYDEDAGIGTLISTMLPFSVCFLLGWTVLLAIWFTFGLPIGIGVGIHM